jgi:hypothetical protein
MDEDVYLFAGRGSGGLGVGKRTIGKLPQEAGMLYYFQLKIAKDVPG